MTFQLILKQWIGLIVGILIIAITYLIVAIIPDPVSGIILFFGAALIAGYLTPGPVKKGAIVRIRLWTGCNLGMLLLIMSKITEPYQMPNSGSWLMVAVLFAIIVIPPNTLGGIIGNILRNGVDKIPFCSKIR